MEIAVLTALAALALALEKATYWWVWHYPQRFQAWYVRQPLLREMADPAAAFERLFRLFKAIQLLVYGGWIIWFSIRTEWLPNGDPLWLSLALLLIAIGQLLNMAVFARLGRAGTFYGVRFGQSVPWVEGFPFSMVSHPQYTGTVLSIWGLFLLMRFPQSDWIALPILATIYYAFNAWFERKEPEAGSDRR
ncbi:MAG: methyltransferase [Halofilum sp. (in: g-proteobacteria)]